MAGCFRRVILQLLPIDKLESEFSKTMGRPSKDLYSVCGLLLIMEFFGWSLSETAMHYMCDLSIQYALNIETEAAVPGERSLVRYLKYMRKKTFMQEAMDIVAETLIRELNIDIRKQRLDSTHIFSKGSVWMSVNLMMTTGLLSVLPAISPSSQASKKVKVGQSSSRVCAISIPSKTNAGVGRRGGQKFA